ncbi:MAG TPA: hypothetical protein VNZ49_03990 [Bacteroidia bacterium]|jgi:hypothetical protein|nr:hypothetical protein [Bacteroidia bacterium]
MTDLIKSESCILYIYDKLVEMLQTELIQYVSNPVISPVSFHIDFKRAAGNLSGVTFYLANGTLNGKMVNLNRNNSAVLNYAFRIGPENEEYVKGLFKVKISEGKGVVSLKRAS